MFFETVLVWGGVEEDNTFALHGSPGKIDEIGTREIGCATFLTGPYIRIGMSIPGKLPRPPLMMATKSAPSQLDPFSHRASTEIRTPTYTALEAAALPIEL